MPRKILFVSALSACLLLMLSAAAPAQPPAPASRPWMDAALLPDQRADLLEAQMTEDEKLGLVRGYFGANMRLPYVRPVPQALRAELPGVSGYVPAIPRLGIPALLETDAGSGIANNGGMRPGDVATALPSGLLDAATWNLDAVFTTGAVLGAEARDRGYNVVLDGAMNLAREPRGGRTFEYAGEDSLLAGTMTGELVRGVESQHVISTVKHFALNDQENGRLVLNGKIDEGALRESDLLAFEIAIERGNPGSVMCAYNRVNGTYACENDFLLNHVLKHDWAYPGWVMSDWGAVHSTAAAANAGLDQESSSGFDWKDFFGDPLRDALKDGSVAPARLDDMVHRILRAMFANGLFDFPPMKAHSTFDTNAEVAERAAAEGIVLLKNDQGLLPLAKTAHSIAVIGAHADVGVLSGGGSSQVVPVGNSPANQILIGGGVFVLPNGMKVMPMQRVVYDPPSPLSAIKAELPNAEIRFSVGCEDIAQAVAAAKKADVAIVFAQQWMTEGHDVSDLSLPLRQNELIDAVAAANPHTIVVLETGGPVMMPWLDKVPAVVEAWYPGNRGAAAIAAVLFGEVNPSGRLPITFPMSESQLPRPVLPPDGVREGFDVDYDIEGANVGYRWFAAKGETPLFPFGFGLSYTQFRIDTFNVQGGSAITASAYVTNIGTREGQDVVEFYAAADGNAAPPRLIGWGKVDLKPGETKRVDVVADARLLAHFDARAGLWRVAAGTYKVTAGHSFADLAAQADVAVTGSDIKP